MAILTKECCIIRSCNASKNHSSVINLQSFVSDNLIETFNTFQEFKESYTGKVYTPDELYRREKLDFGDGYTLSAGFGLVKDDEKCLIPYDITLSENGFNSVYQPKFGLKFNECVSQWGKLVTQKDLLKQICDNHKIVILVASKNYLQAIRDEILKCNPKKLCIISPDYKSSDLKDYLIPTKRKLFNTNCYDTGINTLKYIFNTNEVFKNKQQLISHMNQLIQSIDLTPKKLNYKEKAEDSKLIEILKEMDDLTNWKKCQTFINSKGYAVGNQRLTRLLEWIANNP